MDETVEGLQQLGMQFVKVELRRCKKVEEEEMESPVYDLPPRRRLFAHSDEAVERNVEDVSRGGGGNAGGSGRGLVIENLMEDGKVRKQCV